MDISIVITTFNARHYILETLSSIINQSYKNYEIVIIDDGSTDNTIELVSKFGIENHLDNLKIFKRPHLGRASALNYGVSAAIYDWIAILDADDLWHYTKLEIQCKFIEKYKLDFLATKSKTFFKTEEVRLDETLSIKYDRDYLYPVTLKKILLSNIIPHSSVLIKKHLLSYSQKRKSQIDYQMWFKILQKRKYLHILNYPLIYHRIHKDQSFESRRRFNYILSATRLQLYYCFVNLSFFKAMLVLLKIGYYALLPRRFRLFLREILL